MEIKHSVDLRPSQLPPEHEVRRIVEIVCQRCRFDPSLVKLNYVGGDRRRFFAKQGIKLMRACQFSVQMYIGCPSDTIETHFLLTRQDKRAVAGNELFQTLTQTFKGRTFLIEGEPAGRPQNDRNGHSPTDASPGTPIAASFVEEAPAPAALQPEAGAEEPEEEPVSGSVPDEVPHFKHYFDDPEKLHLAVCGLVALCDENTQTPFSFSRFEQVLEESNVPKTAAPPMSLIRTFLNRSFIQRINPGTHPSRYVLTNDAIIFARGDVPAIESPTPKKSPKKAGSAPAPDAKETILGLKKLAEEHRAILAELQQAQKSLDELKTVNIEQEEAKIDGETANLNKRLEDLRQSKLLLSKRRSDVSSTVKEVDRLTTLSQDPKSKEALRELEEFRKLLE